MSERTEQLILMLTPEEKALIERVSREWNQTPVEFLLELVNETESVYDEDSDEDIIQGLRQGLRDLKAGRVYHFNSVQELLDSSDDED